MSQLKTCDRCQRNSPQTKTFDVLHPVKVVPKPWYLIGIDLIEAPTTSKKGTKYLLTQTDYFTKYVEAVPLPDKSAYGVAKGLYATFCRHGAPVHVISAQGREFVNQVNQWCKSMKIHIFCRVLLQFFFSAHLCLRKHMKLNCQGVNQLSAPLVSFKRYYDPAKSHLSHLSHFKT